MALNPTLRQMNELTVRYTRQTGAKVNSHVLSRVKLIIRILVPGAFLNFKCAAYEAIYPFTCLMYINSRQNRSSILICSACRSNFKFRIIQAYPVSRNKVSVHITVLSGRTGHANGMAGYICIVPFFYKYIHVSLERSGEVRTIVTFTSL